MNPIFVAITTGLLTGGAAVFGVWFTQRRVVFLAYEQRSDGRKEATRKLVGGLLKSARTWNGSVFVAGATFMKSDAENILEWASSETAVAMGRARLEMDQGFVEARMRIAEPALFDAIEHARSAVTELSSLMGPLYPSKRRASRVELIEVLTTVAAKSLAFGGLLDEIESAASELLREPLLPKLPSPWPVRAWSHAGRKARTAAQSVAGVVAARRERLAARKA